MAEFSDSVSTYTRSTGTASTYSQHTLSTYAFSLKDGDNSTIRGVEKIEKPWSSDTIDYVGFLCRMSNVLSIPFNNIERSSSQSYGAGATMIVYPGKWYEKGRSSGRPQAVALKYFNNTKPDGATTMPAYVNSMNWRFKTIVQEVEVMAGNAGRYYDNFPRLMGMCWEEIPSAAGPLYRPIMVMEAAISDLEMYVRNGGLEVARRYEDERRFITSIYTAMNFLHHECALVHGDLKPANVLVFRDQHTGVTDVKLADFGLAYDITAYTPQPGLRRDLPTGTPYWGAPETIPGSYSHRYSVGLYAYTRDYYSLGLVMWFILFGYPIGDLKNGVTEQDEEVLNYIKQGGLMSFESRNDEEYLAKWSGLERSAPTKDILELLKQKFDARWKWEIVDPSALEQLQQTKENFDVDKADDTEVEEVLGDVFKVLVRDGKIKQLKWDAGRSRWVATFDFYNHVYRALLETALQRDQDNRRTVLHKPSEELITKKMAYQLAALSVMGHADPKSAVFAQWSVKFGPTSLRRFEIATTQQWNRKKEEHESGRDTVVPRLSEEAIASLPREMAVTMLEQLIEEASDTTKSDTQRRTAVINIHAFRQKLPKSTDFDAWDKQYANWSLPSEKLAYILAQKLYGEPFDEEEADTWLLEGLLTIPGQPKNEKLLQSFQGIDQSIWSVPVRCAIWDYASEFGLNTPEEPDYSGHTLPGIFQSIIDGNLIQLKAIEASSRNPLQSFVFDGCNLLHFAIIQRKVQIIRYLMVEKGFVVGRGEGYNEALQSLMFDTRAHLTLYELDRCHRLADGKIFTNKEREESSLGPLVNLCQPAIIAIAAEVGSGSFFEVVDNEYREPLRRSAMLYAVSDDKDDEELNPLAAALKTRRLLPFLKLLEWGRSSIMNRPIFSPDAVIDGIPLLANAIVSMAPFFVAALLAKGADVKGVQYEDGSFESFLYMACSCPSSLYLASLKRRQDLHVAWGCHKEVLKQDDLAILNYETDCEALRKLIVALLLKHGADINVGAYTPTNIMTGARQNISPLDTCIRTNNSDLAIFLIENGAEVDPPGLPMSPLHLAITNNLPDVAESLLQHGASPDGSVPLVSGPPLLVAVLYNRPEMFKLLLSRGASLALPVPHYDGEVVLHAMLETTSEMFLRNLVPEDQASTIATAGVTSLDALIRDMKKMRQILLTHLKNMPERALKHLINLQIPDGQSAIFFAAEYIHGVEETDLELLQLIIKNTTNVAYRLPMMGYSAPERALVLGNMAFTSIYFSQIMGGLGFN